MPIVAVPAILLILALVAWQAGLLSRGASYRRARRRAIEAARAAHVAGTGTASESTNPLVRLLQRRPVLRRAFSIGSGLLLVVAIGILGFPLYTNFIHDRIQDRLRNQLTSPELRQAYLERRVQEGDSLTRIQIPSIGVDVVVVEGTGPDALRAGAGHYRSTPLPCENGNVAIAGHRTTYGKPFANLDLLEPGAEITLTTPIGSCKYKVGAVPPGRNANDARNAAFVVTPNEVGVVANSTSPMLTLTTCHPKGSAAKRLVIQATLEPGSSGSGITSGAGA